MRRVTPDHCLREVLRAVEAKTPPLDLFARRVYYHLIGEKLEEKIQYAFDLINDPKDKETLMAFFFSRATRKEISESTWISEDVLEIFETLCIDPLSFRNKLEFLRYARDYSLDCSAYGQKLINCAITVGPSYLVYLHALGHEEAPMDHGIYMRAMAQQSFYLGMLAKSNPITSETTKESLKWLQTAHKLATAVSIPSKVPTDSEEEAMYNLLEKRMNDTSGIDPKEVLHQGSTDNHADSN